LFKTFEFCISGIFHLIFSVHGLLTVTNVESETADKGTGDFCVQETWIIWQYIYHCGICLPKILALLGQSQDKDEKMVLKI
jgi:hypothetical protein